MAKSAKTLKKNKFVKVPTVRDEPSLGKWLWLVLLVALAVKMAYLGSSQDSPFYEPAILDPAYYHQWALRILKGDWIGEGVFYGLPLYPFFLAACYKVMGVSVTAVKAVQLVLGLGTVYLIFKIGKKLFSEAAGLTAAILAVFYGPLFFYESLYVPEALGIPFYAASLYFALEFWEDGGLKPALLFGFFCALATLTKAGALTFVLIFLPVLFFRHLREKRSLFPVLAAALIYAALLAPVGIHNYVYGKDKVLLTAHAGVNFYIGNNENARGVFEAPEGTGSNVESQMQDSRALAESALGRPLKPSEVSKYWSDKAWTYIRGNPADFLKLLLRKAVLFFDAREISDVEDYVFAKKFSAVLNGPWMDFSVLGPLFFVGLFMALRKARSRGVAYLWLATYTAGVLLFFINARYRLPLVSFFIVLAGAGCLELYQSARKKAWVSLLFCLLALAAGIGVTQARLVQSDGTKNYLNAGDILIDHKNYDDAFKFYAEALKINPSSGKANEAMGLVLTKMGRYDEAKDYYLRAIEYEPNVFSAYNQLGLWYDRDGDLQQAKMLFLKALELKPSSSQAHNNLGMAYGKLGDNIRALEEFDASLKLNPNSPRACTNKGLILYRLGKKEEARSLWRRALELDPDFQEARQALAAG